MQMSSAPIHKKGNRIKWKSWLVSDTLLLIVFYFILVVFKMWWVARADSPILFGDEYVYKTVSHSLFSGNGYTSDGVPFGDMPRTVSGIPFATYPPLYPLALMPSFLSRDDWYHWMLWINAWLSSIVIFPTWWIACALLPKRESWLCVFIAAIIPYQVVFPRVIMSENLFIPLFLLAFYMLLASHSNPTKLQYLGTGVIWGLCYLTRHIFFVAIPMLFLAWWIQPWMVRRVHFYALFQRQRFISFGFILLGFIVAYGPWILYSISNRVPILETIGFNIIPRATQHRVFDQGSLIDTLLPWAVFYLCYLVLMSAPYLQSIVIYPFIQIHESQRQILFFVVTLGGLTGAFAVTATLFLWKFFGNSWAEAYIEGRYVMYVVPLLPIWEFFVLNRLRLIPFEIRLSRVILGTGVASLMVFSAYMWLIESNAMWWPLPPFSNNVINSIDSSSFHASLGPLMGGLLTVCLVSMVVQGLSIVFLPRYILVVTCLCLVAFYGFSDWYVARGIDTSQQYNRHGKILASLLSESTVFNPKTPTIPIFFDQHIQIVPAIVEFTIAFWEVPWDTFRVDKYSTQTDPSQAGLLVTNVVYPRPLKSYQVLNATYYVYTLPIASKELSRLSIVEFAPKETHVGQGFNIQPNGESAMWLRVKNVTANTVLVVNDTVVPVLYDGQEIMTLIIPPEYYAVPRTYDLYLLDPLTQGKSNLVKFVVKH
jgi:hypothetical protein